MTKYTCPVCGYPELEDRPRSPTGVGSDEFCPSCGFQFGWHDNDQGVTDEQWRADWIAKGMPWSSLGIPQPQGWDPRAQLDRLLSG